MIYASHSGCTGMQLPDRLALGLQYHCWIFSPVDPLVTFRRLVIRQIRPARLGSRRIQERHSGIMHFPTILVMQTIMIEEITGGMLEYDLIEGTLWSNDRWDWGTLIEWQWSIMATAWASSSIVDYCGLCLSMIDFMSIRNQIFIQYGLWVFTFVL